MLVVSSAREVRGTWKLGPNPDLFMLSTVIALTSDKTTRVSPFPDVPIVRQWISALASHLDFTIADDACIIRRRSPATDAPITLSLSTLPYPAFMVFTLMSLGHRVAVEGLSAKRLERWLSLIRLANCTAESTTQEGHTILSLIRERSTFKLPASDIEADDLQAYIGLALGLGASFSCELDQTFLSPLRHILPLYGYELSVKNTGERVTDPIAKRIARMKKKKTDTATVTYAITANFSPLTPASETEKDEIAITLPGDDILGAALITAKSLFQKGNLIIENMPLEMWNAQMLHTVRRMGCAPAIQQTGNLSYGAVGMIQLQRFELSGRKNECRPWFHFAGHLPFMMVLAAFAEGESVFRGLEDLRLDEPDGVEQYLACLRKLEIKRGEMPDGIVLKGSRHNDGFDIEEELPAPLAAALAIAGLRCQGKTTLADGPLLRRWPDFNVMLKELVEFKDHKNSGAT